MVSLRGPTCIIPIGVVGILLIWSCTPILWCSPQILDFLPSPLSSSWFLGFLVLGGPLKTFLSFPKTPLTYGPFPWFFRPFAFIPSQGFINCFFGIQVFIITYPSIWFYYFSISYILAKPTNFKIFACSF